MKVLWAILICLLIQGCAPVMASNVQMTTSYLKQETITKCKKTVTNYHVKPVNISEIVYQTIAMESADQSYAGQVLVAKVIVNRAKASHKSLETVCKAHHQFSCWNHPKRAKRWLRTYYTSKVRGKAVRALKQAFKMTSLAKITHYCRFDAKPLWAMWRTPSLISGEHLFYGGIK